MARKFLAYYGPTLGANTEHVCIAVEGDLYDFSNMRKFIEALKQTFGAARVALIEGPINPDRQSFHIDVRLVDGDQLWGFLHQHGQQVRVERLGFDTCQLGSVLSKLVRWL